MKYFQLGLLEFVTMSSHFLINLSMISSGRSTTSEYTSPNFTHSISSKVLMTCTKEIRSSRTASLLPIQFRGPPEKGRYVYGFISEIVFSELNLPTPILPTFFQFQVLNFLLSISQLTFVLLCSCSVNCRMFKFSIRLSNAQI